MTLSVLFIALLVFYLILIYNNLVKKKNLVAEGWNGIDVQLKKRADLTPALVDAVKGHIQHERDLLLEITRLRSESMRSDTVPEQEQTEAGLSRSLSRLMVIAENHPELKADTNFLKLQEELSVVENDLQKSRKYYNGTVREFNIRVESFPSNVVANIFSFEKAVFFQLDISDERWISGIKL